MSEEKGKYEVQDASPTIGKLATALVKAQGEMPSAKFNAQNPFLKNRYADLGSVIETARPVLKKHGLAILQPVISSGNGRIGIRTMIIHESGEFISSETFMPIIETKGQTLTQAAGSVISYLRRYTLSSMLGIYADEDTDANGGESDEKPKAKAKPKQDQDVVFGEAEEVARPPMGKSWPGYYVAALVENELADHPKNAVNILNNFPDLARNLPKDKIVMLGEIYRQRRDDNGLSVTQAAETAWSEWNDWNKED